MKASLTEKLCCPFDKHDLSLTIYAQNDEGDIREGILTCAHCQRYYPVIFGVPIMSPDEYREIQLEKPVIEKWGLQLAETKEKKFSLAPGGGKEQIGYNK